MCCWNQSPWSLQERARQFPDPVFVVHSSTKATEKWLVLSLRVTLGVPIISHGHCCDLSLGCLQTGKGRVISSWTILMSRQKPTLSQWSKHGSPNALVHYSCQLWNVLSVLSRQLYKGGSSTQIIFSKPPFKVVEQLLCKVVWFACSTAVSRAQMRDLVKTKSADYTLQDLLSDIRTDVLIVEAMVKLHDGAVAQ